MKTAVSKKSKAQTHSLSGIVDRAPGDLRPWPGNPRTHSDKQLAKLKASILKFGFTAPVLVDEAGCILSGHGRVLAAQGLGLTTIPTRVISGLSEAQKRAYVIADNKLSQLSAWDQDLLKTELELLIQDDFDIETTGFSTAEIDVMLYGAESAANHDPDDLQEDDIAAEIVSKPGDLWQLGNHRLLCGNALEADAYSSVMQGELAQMVITDPPYNVPVNGHVCGKGKVKHKEFAMASGEMSPVEFTKFLNNACSHLKNFSKKGAIHFIFMDWRHMAELQNAADPVFGQPRQVCIWVKDNGGMGTFYRSQHEMVFVYKHGNTAHINNFELGQHGRYRTNVWSYPGVNTLKGKGFELLALHPTVKPVGLIADAIRDCSHRKGLILDPFGGSGTVLAAAERTGRHARVIELDPRYVDVAVMRWQRITHMEALLEATGQPWRKVHADRVAAAK